MHWMARERKWSIVAPVSSVLRIGELEIHHEHRRCAGGQQGSAAQPWRLCSAYLHGQFTRASVLKGTTLCSGLGRGVSAWDKLHGEYPRPEQAVQASNGLFQFRDFRLRASCSLAYSRPVTHHRGSNALTEWWFSRFSWLYLLKWKCSKWLIH